VLKKLKYRLEVLKKLSGFAIGVKKYFLIIIIISCLNVVVSLVTPTFYKMFVDDVIIAKDSKAFIFVVAGYLSMFAINTTLAFLRNYCNNRLLNRTIFSIKRRLLDRYFMLHFQDYEKRNTGDLKMRIDDDVLKLSDFAGLQSVDYLKAVVTAIFAAILIIKIQWLLAIFSMIVIPLTFYADHKISLKEMELHNINRGNSQDWNSWLHTSIQGWKEVRALNLQKHELRIFVRYAHNFANFFGRWINYWVLRVLVIPKIKDEFLMKFALYFFGGLLIMKNQLTIGGLLVFAMYYDLLSESIRAVSTTDAELQSNMPFYNRVIEELNSYIKREPIKKLQPSKNCDISMRNVKFAYEKEQQPVIENLSLEIKQGERVAIVGRSGVGKTTVLKLLTGMLLPDSGEVMFGDIDIQKISSNMLYKRIGYVLQENFLFNATIRENLRLARPSANLDMMDEACKKAYIYDFIVSLPNGYDTVIGEKGIKLSGGQRQRLMLASLFLRDVDVMIFDEATSSLDQYSESIIYDAINSIDQDKTIIVVAHRESSIALCNRIINLSEVS